MDRQKGVAYCGLACALCGQNATCAGCRNEGCTSRDWCKSYNCCRERGLSGCWECAEFPCADNKMLSKMRVRAFAGVIRKYGEDRLLDCLEKNEQAGMRYHYDGLLTGDYDTKSTEREITELILHGAPTPGQRR
ncbi:MAG: DUF3795 domain-containing protein [Acetanaerobacterium sp.]